MREQAALAHTRLQSRLVSVCAEQVLESDKLNVARRRSRGAGDSPCFAFLLQAFSFSNKKKMPKRR